MTLAVTQHRALRAWVVLLSTVALATALEAGIARESWVLAAAAGLAVVAALDSGVLRTPALRVRLPLLVAATLGLQLAGTAWAGPGWRYETGWGLAYALLGWAAVLAVLALPVDAPRQPPREPAFGWRAAGLLAVVAGLALVHYAMRDRFEFSADGIIYNTQAVLLREGRLGLPLGASLQPYLQPMLTFVGRQGLTGEYTPGWPFILAVFGAVGLRWWAGVAAGVVAVAATYRLGARLRSPAAGLVAAAVLATCEAFAYEAGTYMAHVPALALCVTAAYLMLPRAADRRASAALWTVAGLLLGWAVAVRPLTGVALGAAIWWWSVARLDPAQGRRVTLAMVAGGLAPMVALLAYNAATTGSALRFGYQAAGLQNLGFGLRGFTRYTGTGQPWFDSRPFSALDGVRNTLYMLARAARDFGPVGALLPLALMAKPLGADLPWRRLAPFALLPVAYAAYFWKDVRFYTELLPFIALGVAVLIADVRLVSVSRARALLVLFLMGQLAVSAVRIGHAAETFRRGSLPYLHAVADAARQDSVLVVLRDEDRSGILFSTLWFFNEGPFPGRVVVARDAGDGDSALLRAFPGRRVLRLTVPDSGWRSVPPRLLPLDGLAAAR